MFIKMSFHQQVSCNNLNWFTIVACSPTAYYSQRKYCDRKKNSILRLAEISMFFRSHEAKKLFKKFLVCIVVFFVWTQIWCKSYSMPTLNFSNLRKTCNIGLPSLLKAGIDAQKVVFEIEKNNPLFRPKKCIKDVFS